MYDFRRQARFTKFITHRADAFRCADKNDWAGTLRHSQKALRVWEYFDGENGAEIVPFWVGKSFYMLGRFADAEAPLAHACQVAMSLTNEGMRITPTLARIMILLSSALLKLGRESEAFGKADLAVRTARAQGGRADYADAQSLASAALFWLGRYTEALERVKDAAVHAPTHAEILSRHALVCRHLGAREIAGEVLDRARHADLSGETAIVEELFWHVAEEGDEAAVIAFLEKHPLVRRRFAAQWVTAVNGSVRDRAWFERALDSSLKAPEEYLASILIAIASDNKAKARELVQSAPDAMSAQYLLSLASAAWFLGDEAEARRLTAVAKEALERRLQEEPGRGRDAQLLAWLLVSTPAADLRDGARALHLLEKSERLAGKPFPEYPGTAANLRVASASHAECGDRETATRLAELAVATAAPLYREAALRRLRIIQAGGAIQAGFPVEHSYPSSLNRKRALARSAELRDAVEEAAALGVGLEPDGGLSVGHVKLSWDTEFGELGVGALTLRRIDRAGPIHILHDGGGRLAVLFSDGTWRFHSGAIDPAEAAVAAPYARGPSASASARAETREVADKPVIESDAHGTRGSAWGLWLLILAALVALIVLWHQELVAPDLWPEWRLRLKELLSP